MGVSTIDIRVINGQLYLINIFTAIIFIKRENDILPVLQQTQPFANPSNVIYCVIYTNINIKTLVCMFRPLSHWVN